MNIRTYPAALVRVIDGDTMVMRVDHGMNISSEQHLRLLGTSCPEMNEPGGLEARTATEQWFTEHPDLKWPFLIQTVKNSKDEEQRTFIRYLATVFRNTVSLHAPLNMWLVENGFGTTN